MSAQVKFRIVRVVHVEIHADILKANSGETNITSNHCGGTNKEQKAKSKKHILGEAKVLLVYSSDISIGDLKF